MSEILLTNTEDIRNQLTNFGFYKNLKDSNKLYINGRIVNNKVFEELRTIIKLTNYIYDDNWDIKADVITLNNNKILDIDSIIIYFPEITIKNTGDNQHLIRNLFVKLETNITDDRLIISNILGARGTVSLDEFISSYRHSHLPATKNKSFEFSVFCKGSGEINAYLMEFNTSVTEEITLKLLLQLLAYVSHESIEGSPYIKMERIRTCYENNEYVINKSKIDLLKDAIDKYLIHNKDYKKAIEDIHALDFRIKQNKIEIINNQKFLLFVKSIIHLSSRKESLFCIETINNNNIVYVSLGTNKLNTLDSVESDFFFRNERISFKIESGSEDKTIITVHPYMIELVKKYIENKINEKIIG